jgi:iron complex outermembrane receptor protein
MRTFGEDFMTRFTRTCLLTTVAATLIAGAPAWAQEQPADDNGAIADIIVTANKTGASSVQRTPIAISAFSGDDLAGSHIVSTKDLGQIVPSLAVSQFSTYAQIYIRGVGSNNSFNGSDPSVTVHADGVYLARPFAQFMNFLDVERVEVLRGPRPQGADRRQRRQLRAGRRRRLCQRPDRHRQGAGQPCRLLCHP